MVHSNGANWQLEWQFPELAIVVIASAAVVVVIVVVSASCTYNL